MKKLKSILHPIKGQLEIRKKVVTRTKVAKNKVASKTTRDPLLTTNGRTTIKKLVVKLVAKREVKISRTMTLVVKTVAKL